MAPRITDVQTVVFQQLQQNRTARKHAVQREGQIGQISEMWKKRGEGLKEKFTQKLKSTHSNVGGMSVEVSYNNTALRRVDNDCVFIFWVNFQIRT